MDVWSHDHADHLERLKRLDGMKVQNKATGGVWKVMGNLRFPLDKTYHRCAQNCPLQAIESFLLSGILTQIGKYQK